jgi:cytochrome c-type biogenesis protein CcmH
MSLLAAIALVGMTSLALAALLLPLLLGRGPQIARDAYNLAVYRDQLAEVERDVGRGVLSAEQATAARAEIGRRILVLEPEDRQLLVARPKPVAAAIVAILALPVAALLIYAALGSPSQPDQPFAERAAAEAQPPAADHVDMQAALAKLRAHLQASPDDLDGWLLFARTELGLGQYQAGADAYHRAVELSGNRADVMGDWGEALVLAAEGTVTPAAQAAFRAGLGDPEAAPRSRYYLALAQMQQGDAKGALATWQALEKDSPADAAWLPVLRQRIAEASARLGLPAPAALAGAAPASVSEMPSTATVANVERATAGASPDERQAMINAMVARLAARLQQQPDDPDGWARLGRSYMVLGQPAKARDAYAHAVTLRPDDTALKESLAEATSAAAAQPPAPAK